MTQQSIVASGNHDSHARLLSALLLASAMLAGSRAAQVNHIMGNMNAVEKAAMRRPWVDIGTGDVAQTRGFILAIR